MPDTGFGLERGHFASKMNYAAVENDGSSLRFAADGNAQQYGHFGRRPGKFLQRRHNFIIRSGNGSHCWFRK